MKLNILLLLASASLLANSRLVDRIRYRLEDNNVEEMEFVNFIATYGRRFGTKAEYLYRLNIFTDKYRLIQEHNSDSANKYKLGVNKFMDFSDDEWENLLTYREEVVDEERVVGADMEVLASAPETHDWREYGALTEVKDQASCGACWAFTAAETLESAHFLKTGELHILSEQQLVDCSKEYGNMGCFGGLFKNAFAYMVDYPLMLEADYPYEAKSIGTSCRYDSTKGVVQASGYHFVQPKSPDALLTNVLRQPLSVGIQANTAYFQLYKEGILDDEKCGGDNIDHAVQLIGYGYDSELEEPYWLFRNQWGTGWGEEGFFRVLRDTVEGGTGICGIQKRILFPDA
eukprot:CAMPEP_0202960856 /NCGR_PEP_ID=MMETSP1396-20130829/5005_1 /ASSEMBLY_ACC=CAM_ASM_000872 /TAXON_ID= /ORGANISM="Pseudokeronopsis sp., Strain Brazil" /LENGTH=344 /DNA_ID=CAMNT_0049680349 /DNA_START=16 /DNA_END=1050 /DNA_ORIENTATION=+